MSLYLPLTITPGASAAASPLSGFGALANVSSGDKDSAIPVFEITTADSADSPTPEVFFFDTIVGPERFRGLSDATLEGDACCLTSSLSQGSFTCMGIAERRERERERRRYEILNAAWKVAESSGWAAFSLERVAAQAELGRATVYGYFASVQDLVTTLAEEALEQFTQATMTAATLTEALDAPLKFAQERPAAFSLLFETVSDARPAFTSADLDRVRTDARRRIRALRRMVEKAGTKLPENAADAEAFLEGIALAGALVPDLRTNTPLRHKWQMFCLEPTGGLTSPMSELPATKGGDPSAE